MLKGLLHLSTSSNNEQTRISLNNMFKEIRGLDSYNGTRAGFYLLYAIKNEDNKSCIKIISKITKMDEEDVEKVVKYLRKPKNKKPIKINISGRTMTSGEYNSRFNHS